MNYRTPMSCIKCFKPWNGLNPICNECLIRESIEEQTKRSLAAVRAVQPIRPDWGDYPTYKSLDDIPKVECKYKYTHLPLILKFVNVVMSVGFIVFGYYLLCFLYRFFTL